MERGKRSETINGEIELPEAIIQQIQSYLDGKEAAQTIVLSKLWYNAWLTSPILDFDQRNFRIGDSESEAADRFRNFVKKTMERYQEMNLKIVKFRLWMTIGKPDSVSRYVANELIMKALKMGVSELNLELPHEMYFYPNEMYALPHEVLEAETLIRLSVTGCRIGLPLDRKVLCSRLESLSLCKVCTGGDLVWDIISSCPSIENLLLSECRYFVGDNKFRRVAKIWTFRSPLIEVRKLKCLFLQKVIVNEQFFNDFSLKFPCLEDLSLHYCIGYKQKRRQISSHSLKCISVTAARMLWVNFDVPNIRKFTFLGTIFPRLSFTSALKEFESHISISCYSKHLKASWFHELKRFLTELIPSDVSLNLWFFKVEREPIRIDHVGEIEGLPRPVLENLILSLYSELPICSAFLDGIFWSCRPKVITVRSSSLELLCNRLMQQVNENYWIPSQNVFGQDGLEEVNVESFEKTLKEWRSMPWSAFLDSLNVEENIEQFRFLLKWRA